MKLFLQKLIPTPPQTLTMVSELNDEACPNCWGHVEYAGAFCEATVQRTKLAVKAPQRKGWVLRYAENYLPGFQQLRNDLRRLRHNC